MTIQTADRKYLAQYDCYLLERVPYCSVQEVPSQQCMNIYIPAVYLTEEGTPGTKVHANGFSAASVPVIFENGLAGYMEAEPFDIEDGRSAAKDFLNAGFVYVSCGCRGRSSVNEAGERCGKSPLSLVDLKAGIRFLKANRGVIPGDMDRIISVGISAGGAMSTLLGSTGNSVHYEAYLRDIGAEMDQTDDIFAAQCYCPIIDLDHADLAYEWMFRGQTHYQGMPFVGFGEGDLTPFAAALSDKLADAYVSYFNGLDLTDAQGQSVQIGRAHEGRGCELLMEKLTASAEKYLRSLRDDGVLSGPRITCAGSGDRPTVQAYLSGNYEAHAFNPSAHAEEAVPGIDKTGFLTWDGDHAALAGIDAMQKSYHTRLKKSPAFDDLDLIQAENQEFGTPVCDKLHFNTYLAEMIDQLRGEYPDEAEKYLAGYQQAAADEALADRRYLINPMNFIGTQEKADLAPHYRIRVGSRDADTSLTITLTLALKLAASGCSDVDYEIVWDEPHGRADYPGEVTAWVQSICQS